MEFRTNSPTMYYAGSRRLLPIGGMFARPARSWLAVSRRTRLLPTLPGSFGQVFEGLLQTLGYILDGPILAASHTVAIR